MPDFQQKTIDNKIILFDPVLFPSPEAEMFDGTYWQAKNSLTGSATGRGTTYFFRYNNSEFVLRHYRRGGLIGKFLHDQYLYTGLRTTRAWQEFQLLTLMRELHLPAPRPAAACVEHNGRGYYRADLISEKIPDASDLHQLLLTTPLDKQTWHNIGKTIGNFHRHQVFHHDLNIHNIMLDNQQKVWLIDFDKCHFRAGEKWKAANIERLKRSILKEQSLHNQYQVDETTIQSLLAGYVC
ncbi:MAG: 3-deoxy-D-manno-octulosonic acid kinase [Congregibacter sp.]|jgi:3-deoxy-D-manno-octulosonic acid kinase